MHETEHKPQKGEQKKNHPEETKNATMLLPIFHPGVGH